VPSRLSRIRGVGIQLEQKYIKAKREEHETNSIEGI
jgi:hypothetical protein